MTVHADIAIIGAGPGGYVAALRASQLGAKVVCVEKGRLGGVCLNEGCIPTKTLLRSAQVLALAKKAQTYGVMVNEPTLDWAKAQSRKEQIVDQLRNGLVMLLDRADVQVFQGQASFVGPNTLSLQTPRGQETIVAGDVIIATGSSTVHPPIPGLEDARVTDHSGALGLDSLPESMCIIGGGSVGLEFASLFNTLGVEVTLLEMLPCLAPQMDAAIGEGLAWSLSNRGVGVLTNTRVTGVAPTGSGCLVSMTGPQGEQRVEAELVVLAVGRAPNATGLGLEVLGIRPTREGIQVDGHMRTVVPHVYAIGDVVGETPMLAHVAMYEGIVAVENALGHPMVADYTAVPKCIFSSPEAASVGLSEKEAREGGYDVQVGVFGLDNSAKALAMGDTEGFVKVVSEAKYGSILGMHIVGPHASDLVLEGTLAISMEATLDEIEHTIHPHPTLGEAIREAALAARGRSLHLPQS